MLRGREEAECEELTVSWVQRLRPAVPRQAVIQIYNHRAAALLTRTQTRPPQTTLDTGYSLTATCDEHDASTHKTRNFKDCNHIKPWYFSCFLTISTFRVFGSPTSDGMLLPLIKKKVSSLTQHCIIKTHLASPSVPKLKPPRTELTVIQRRCLAALCKTV